MAFFKEKLKITDSNKLYPLFFTIVFILILIQYSFSTLDAIFYDLWISFDFSTKPSQQIILVSLDEESDEFLGETYPYTYATHTRFFKKILEQQPSIINFLVQLQEPQTAIESRFAEDVLKQIQNYTYNSGHHFRFGTSQDLWGEQLPPIDFRSIGYSLAILKTDSLIFSKDDVSRRAILNFSGEDSLHLWTANKIRSIKNERELEPNSFKGAYYNSEADATFALFKYPGNIEEEKTEFSMIPYHRVLVGNFPKDYFKDKVVLIGPKYISNSDDFIFTPFEKEKFKSPKILVHASIIQSLAQKDTVLEIPNLITDIIAIIMAIILSFLISRMQPTKGLITTVLIMFAIFLIAFLLFVFFGLWLKLSHIILSIFVVYYIWVPFRAIREYQTRYAIEEETKLLKKVDNLKQNFISLMSHDLKTPVAKIAGIADILSVQFQNSKKQDELIQNIIHSTKDLNSFITSILDLTKVESQKIELKTQSKDVNNILENCIEKLRYEAESQDINFQIELAPLYPIKLDPTLINRVLSNLIENAIKYSGPGSLVMVRTFDDDQWVFIEISDNGAGIDPTEIDHIFEKFYRVKNDSVHKIKGSGLGLYLVKYFVELHGGSISVASELGKGTKFTIKLKNE